jgi:hypothetical protein
LVERGGHTSEEEILAEAKGWVPDPGQTRTRETKYFRLAEVYWITKAMVTQALAQQQQEHAQALAQQQQDNVTTGKW